MANSFSIRIATRDDASSIAQFNVIFAKSNDNRQLSLPVTAAGVRRVFDTFNNGLYIVAERENEIIGVTMVTREWSDWSNGFFYCIQDIFVQAEDPNYEIHDALLNKVVELAKLNEDVCGIRLYVLDDDKKTQEHYTAKGIKKTKYQVFEMFNEDAK
jgi:hypothetical protein